MNESDKTGTKNAILHTYSLILMSIHAFSMQQYNAHIQYHDHLY